MLEKPNIRDEVLVACLEQEFGLQIAHITFLPLGGDLGSAVYQATADDEVTYFCKLRRGVFDEISVELPRFFSDRGIAPIIAPLATKTGRLWTELSEFKLMLYPYVEGTNGYEVELSEQQWANFGTALKKIHTTNPTSMLISKIRKERYAPEWRESCRNILSRLKEETFDDPITRTMSEFLQSKREMIMHALGRAEQLAQDMASRSLEFVLCHSDIHPGNLFIDTKGSLFIVDWDYPMLAPKERDLMFIGGGQGFKPYVAEQEEILFYRGYGQVELDPVALTYYRYERGLMDMTVESERILSSTLGRQDRTQSLEILQLYFLPGCTLEMASKSDQV
jgi:spectinomycin phosphotransferase